MSCNKVHHDKLFLWILPDAFDDCQPDVTNLLASGVVEAVDVFGVCELETDEGIFKGVAVFLAFVQVVDGLLDSFPGVLPPYFVEVSC